MSRKGGIILLLLVLCAVGYILWCYFHIFNGVFSSESEEFARFGDYVGGTIGAVMALISIFLLYITYKQQVDSSLEQSNLSRKTQFETNLFQLLSIQRDIRNEVLVTFRDSMDSAKEKHVRGFDAISKVVEDLKLHMLNLEYEGVSLSALSFNELKAKVNDIFCQSMDVHDGYYLSHYFRHLYHIFKYIDDYTFTEGDKKEYITIVQSELSNDELFLLFFNAVSKYGYPNLYKLVEKYEILGNLHYDEFDYFKLLQRRCYPNTFFKHSPNNAIIIAGYFSKLREPTLLKLSEKLGAEIADVEDINYNSHGAYRVRFIGGRRTVVRNLSEVVSTNTLYLFDTSFVTRGGVDGFCPISDNVFRKLNPKAVIVCVDDARSIMETLPEGIRHHLTEESIVKVGQMEKGCAVEFCDKYNLPYLDCASNEFDKMFQFVRGL